MIASVYREIFIFGGEKFKTSGACDLFSKFCSLLRTDETIAFR